MKSLLILLAIVFGFSMPAAHAAIDTGSVLRKHDLSWRHHHHHHRGWSIHNHHNPVHTGNPAHLSNPL
jgi:hypothetical protein